MSSKISKLSTANKLTILAALAVMFGACLPVIKIRFFFTPAVFTLLQNSNGWFLLLLAFTGIAAGITNSAVLSFLGGSSCKAAFIYLHEQLFSMVRLSGIRPMTTEIGFYLILAGSATMIITPFFWRIKR